MKKFLLFTLFLIVTLGLTSCGKADVPLNEAQQAEKYGLSLEEYKQQKDAAARMNMTIEDHLKMGGDGDHSSMNMSDDSHMVEDDSEVSDEKEHMEKMHPGEDVEVHGSDEHGKY